MRDEGKSGGQRFVTPALSRIKLSEDPASASESSQMGPWHLCFKHVS